MHRSAGSSVGWVSDTHRSVGSSAGWVTFPYRSVGSVEELYHSVFLVITLKDLNRSAGSVKKNMTTEPTIVGIVIAVD